MTFNHHISFAIDLAANLGCYRFRITPDIVSKLLRAAIWSRCSVLFKSEQPPLLRTGRRFRPAALHRIWFRTCCLFLCHIFTQRPMTDRKIERSDGRCFGRQQLLANSIEFFISHEKKVTRQCPKFTTLLTLELSQYCKSGSMFSSSEPAATAADLKSPCVRPAQAEESGPKSLAVDFAL